MSDETPNTGGARAESVGARLSQAREAKGLQLAQAAEAMRLSPEVLGALEADQFDTLGAQVFVKGHLRQYAHLLDVDGDAIIAGYERQDHPTDEPFVGIAAEPIKLRDDRELRLMAAVGTIIVLLVALFVWLWATPDEPEPNQTGAAEPSLPAQLVAPTTVSESAVESVELPTPARVEQPSTIEEVADSPADTVPAEPSVTSAESPTVPITFAVEVTFTEDCWAEIFGGDDERLFYGLGRAGARSRFTTTPPMTVLLGNAGGVQISVNGDAYPIPVGARQGNLARFVVVDLP